MGLLRGRTERQTAPTGNDCARFFSAAAVPATLHREAKEPGFAILRFAPAPSLCSGVQVRAVRRLSPP